MIDEDLDPSFPLVQKIMKSVFASLPRSRNPFEILKNFLTTSPASEMKTVASNQVEEVLNDRATEQAPFLNFTKPKPDSCCKKAVESSSNDLFLIFQ